MGSMLEEHRGQEKEYTSDEANIPSILPSKENLAKILVKKNLLSTLDSKTDEKKSINNSNDRLCSLDIGSSLPKLPDDETKEESNNKKTDESSNADKDADKDEAYEVQGANEVRESAN